MSDEKGQQAAKEPPEQTHPVVEFTPKAAAQLQAKSQETAPEPYQEALVERPSLFPPWTADPASEQSQGAGPAVPEPPSDEQFITHPTASAIPSLKEASAEVKPGNTEASAEVKLEPVQNGSQAAQEPPGQALSTGLESAAVPQVESQAIAPENKKVAHSARDSLAKRIKAEHQQVFAALNSGLRHARNAGELLCKAKDQVRHGEWKQWIETNCEFSIRTAQVYIQIAEGWDQIAAKAQPVALLPMGQALQLLSGQPKPQNQPPLEALIVGLVEKRQAGLTQAELVSEALKDGFKSGSGKVANMVQRACTRLVKKNKLSRDDDMKYRLVRPASEDATATAGADTSSPEAAALGRIAKGESSANGEMKKRAKQKGVAGQASQAPLTSSDLVATLQDIEQQLKAAQLRSDLTWTKAVADECRTLLDRIKEFVPTYEEASC